MTQYSFALKRILTAAVLLISVSFNTYSQNNFSKNKIKLTHPLNYFPSSKPLNNYRHFLFRTAVPETLYVYAVRVQFKPDNEEQTTGDGRFDVSNNYPDSVDAPPHDSLYFIYKLEFLKNYYWKASKGRLFINYKLLDGVRNLSKEMKEYSPLQNENLLKMGNLFFDAWKSADSVVDFSGIDPSKSAFVIFHAGVGRDVNLTGYFQGGLDLPSVYLGINTLKSLYGDTTRGYYTGEGPIIQSSCLLPEQEWRIINTTFGSSFLELGLNGIVVGTIGSHLGLPDLFDTDDGTTAIGRFGLMDGQGIFSYLGVFPPEPCAWEKQYLGWVEPITVYSDAIYTSKAASIDFNGNESVYKILISGKEYYLVENRNRDANNNGQTVYFVKNGVRDSIRFLKDVDGFDNASIWKLKGSIVDVDELDWSVPGLKNDTADFQGGILVWHIDENIIDEKIGSNTINADIKRRGVDVEEAKGSQDIGVVVPTPFGDLISDGFFVDFWYNGNHYRPSNIYRNEFTPTSTPNTRSNLNLNSRVCITNFSSIGSAMTFSYSLCSDIKNINTFPRYVGKDNTGNAQPIGFDYNGNGFDEIFVNVKDSLYGFRDNGNSIRADKPNGFLKDSASQFIVGYLNYNISGQNKFVVGVSRNNLNFLYFTIDSTTSAPQVLQFSSPYSFSTPHLLNSSAQPNPFNRIYIGAVNGRAAKFSLDSLSFSYDSVSNRKIVSLAYGISGVLPGSYAFIDDNFKFFASSDIFNGPQPSGPFTYSVKITNDNKVTRKETPSLNDIIISDNLGINTVYSSPTICDLNGDGQQDIIFSADNKLYAINKFGVVLDNFPFSITGVNRISGGIAVADLNADNIADVIFGTGDGRVFAYGINGKALDGFPLTAGSTVNSTPAIVNSAGNFGIVVYAQDGYLYGWKTPWAYDSGRVLWKN